MMEENLQISFSKAEALVLFEFLARYDESNELTILDPSEETVLWKILGALEKELVEPFDKNYLELLEAARASLRYEEDSEE